MGNTEGTFKNYLPQIQLPLSSLSKYNAKDRKEILILCGSLRYAFALFA